MVYITGIEKTTSGHIYYLSEEIAEGLGMRYYGRVYSRTEFANLFVGDYVTPEFAQGQNGWYIKSLKKGA